MTSRQRVLKAVNFQAPDRIPITHCALPAAFFKYGQRLIDLLGKYPHDFGPTNPVIPDRNKIEIMARAGENIDEWGCIWKNMEVGLEGQVIKFPLESWDALKDYKFPALPREEDVLKRKEGVEKNKEQYFIKGRPFGLSNIFERLQWLRGYENLLIDLVQESKELEALTDQLIDYMLKGIRLAFLLEPDVICFSDDWGTQRQLIISPNLWRKFFKPRYQKLFDAAHKGGAKTYLHSDGQIMEIVPDFIEIGLDILNPQFSCMDLAGLAKIVKGRLVIDSDIDRQYLLPFGTTDEVRDYVKKVMETFDAKKGGFIGRGEISRDVPLENAEAMFKAFLE